MNYLQIAFEQSILAVGISRPNPAVGAVVVRDGIVVGKGRTQRPGNAHAEVMALRDAGENARGAAIYVTLEPCCHYGRTPPCTKAIIEAGIAEVYYAHADPNPLVRGKSRSILEEAGIKVFEGLDACEKAVAEESWDDYCGSEGCKVLSSPIDPEASRAELRAESRMLFHEIERFFEAYDYFVRNKATFVEIKSAISQDGFMGVALADASHAPLKITAQGANCWNHELRSMSDAVLVGAGTLLADNPKLDVRFAQGNSPVKILWAGHHVFAASEMDSLHFFESHENSAETRIVFSCVEQPNVKNVEVVLLTHATFAENWKDLLADLARRGMHRLMVEPGARLASALFECGMWNRLDLWQSSDASVERSLDGPGREGIPYPELPCGVVAKESFMVGPDVLTVYEK